MELTREEVLRVAELAGLELAPDEVDRMRAELSGILAHVAQLGRGAEPRQVGAAPLRPDDPGADPLLEAPSSFAPAWSDGFFTVPRLASHDDPGGAGEGT